MLGVDLCGKRGILGVLRESTLLFKRDLCCNGDF